MISTNNNVTAKKEPVQGSSFANHTTQTVNSPVENSICQDSSVVNADTPVSPADNGTNNIKSDSAGDITGTTNGSTGQTSTKKKQATIADVRTALKDMGVSVRFNSISGLAEIKGMPTQYSFENAANVLPALLGDYFKVRGISAPRQLIDDALIIIMDENRFNPVMELLDATPYSGMDYISMLVKILGIDEDDFSCTLLRKWCHQTVALALNDDKEPFGADGVLVLQGEQGEGKTFFFHAISVYEDLFAEGVSIDLNNKDSVIQSTGAWIAELGELDSTLKREQSSLKAFLTSRRDTYRVPYGRTYIRRARRTSFCATVNPPEFLMDETGSRRFWVVHVHNIDLGWLKSLDKDWFMGLWRQVYEELYLPDPQGFRLSSDERKELYARNHSYEKPLPGEIDIISNLNLDDDAATWVWCSASQAITTLDIHGINSIQAGRVLAKLAKNNVKIQQKTSHGTKYYLLPIR